MSRKIIWSTLILQVAMAAMAFYVGYQLLPKIWANYQIQGMQPEGLVALDLQGQVISLQGEGLERKILVFWATWCGPCEVEIGRLKSAAEANEIAKDEVVLISLNEAPALVVQEARKRGYPFPLRFDQDGHLANLFKVTATPTVAFVDEKSTIVWLTAGLSPSLIWRAKKFLKP